jgi:hypothetical protein
MSDALPWGLGLQYDIFDWRTPRILEQDEATFLNVFSQGWENWEKFANGNWNGYEDFPIGNIRNLVFQGLTGGKPGTRSGWSKEFIRDHFLLWYRRAKKLAALPDDSEYDGRGPTQIGDWPEPGPQKTRLVYWIEDWTQSINRDPRTLLQISRYSISNKRWYIYNQWGQDLTYVRDSKNINSWTSGFDLGTWISQNANTLAMTFQAIIQAIASVMSLGAASIGLVAGTAVALMQAGIEFFHALGKGEPGAMFNAVLKALNLSGLGNIAKEQINIAVNTLRTGPLSDISNVIIGAYEQGIKTKDYLTDVIAKSLPRVDDAYFTSIKKQLGDDPWIDRGFKFPGRTVPAFAQPFVDLGETFGQIQALQNKAIAVNKMRRVEYVPPPINQGMAVVSAALQGSKSAVEIIKETPKNTDAGRSLQASLDIIKGQEYVRMLARKYGIAL